MSMSRSLRVAVLLAAASPSHALLASHGCVAHTKGGYSTLRLARCSTIRLDASAEDADAIEAAAYAAASKRLEDKAQATRIADQISIAIEEMREAGMTDDEIVDSPMLQRLGALKAELEGALPDVVSKGPPPTSGIAEWGRWSFTDTEVSLEVFIGDARAKDVRCEVADGCLAVGVGGDEAPPLLFGRFQMPVVGPHLTWALDEEEDGRRVLCIALPRKERGMGDRATPSAIFDLSLVIDGEPVDVEGLSRGTIDFSLPPEEREVDWR